MLPLNYVGTSLYSCPFNIDANKGLFIPFPNREIKDSLTSICAAQGSGTPAQKLDVFPLGTQVIHSLSCRMTNTNNMVLSLLICGTLLSTLEAGHWSSSRDASMFNSSELAIKFLLFTKRPHLLFSDLSHFLPPPFLNSKFYVSRQLSPKAVSAV